MAAIPTGVSLPQEMRDRLRAESGETGLKVSTIVQQALSARWAAQDARQPA